MGTGDSLLTDICYSKKRRRNSLILTALRKYRGSNAAIRDLAHLSGGHSQIPKMPPAQPQPQKPTLKTTAFKQSGGYIIQGVSVTHLPLSKLRYPRQNVNFCWTKLIPLADVTICVIITNLTDYFLTNWLMAYVLWNLKMVSHQSMSVYWDPETVTTSFKISSKSPSQDALVSRIVFSRNAH